MTPSFILTQIVCRRPVPRRPYRPIESLVIVAITALVTQARAAQPVDAWASDRPNIVHIMADDLGYGDLGCFGQKRIQTPRLDRLATEGMRLTSYYAGCTVCRPSSLVLWTGKRTGHTAINSNAGYVFQPSDVTVAELLHEARYATGGVGKWAMGGVDTSGHPNRTGFDFWMGYLDQGDAHDVAGDHRDVVTQLEELMHEAVRKE